MSPLFTEGAGRTIRILRNPTKLNPCKNGGGKKVKIKLNFPRRHFGQFAFLLPAKRARRHAPRETSSPNGALAGPVGQLSLSRMNVRATFILFRAVTTLS
jgi:hypothetical protein